jgi:uridine kinase
MNGMDENALVQAKKIVVQILGLLARKGPPILIALDGGSGAGKSTIASVIAQELDAALIPLDDFFSANIADSQWDEFTVEEKLERVFDWNRLRQQAIEPLLNGMPARWYAFDFQSGLRADGTYGMETTPKERMPAQIILIDGAYSSSPQLADLVDVAVLVDVPMEERYARLASREDPDFLKTWHRRWDEVEAYYFEHVRPTSSFDIVVELK